MNRGNRETLVLRHKGRQKALPCDPIRQREAVQVAYTRHASKTERREGKQRKGEANEESGAEKTTSGELSCEAQSRKGMG